MGNGEEVWSVPTAARGMESVDGSKIVQGEEERWRRRGQPVSVVWENGSA